MNFLKLWMLNSLYFSYSKVNQRSTFLKTAKIAFMLDKHFLETVSGILEFKLSSDVTFVIIVGLIVAFN